MNVRSTPLVLATFLASAHASAQSTWYVDVNGTAPGSGTPSDPYTSIQYCVAQGSTLPDDLVIVSPGLYLETVELAEKPLVIRSSGGPSSTIVQAPVPESVIVFTRSDGARLAGFTLRLGSGVAIPQGTGGGGVFCDDSDVELSGCVITQNDATLGGGVYAVNGSSLCVVGCTISENEAEHGGGLYAAGSDVEILQSSFAQNSLAATPSGVPEGGGLRVDGPGVLSLLESSVTGNGSTDDARGGGIRIGSGLDVTIEHCTISENRAGYELGNSASSKGGGVYCDSPAVVRYCTISDNRAYLAGGGWFGAGELHDSTVSSNRAVHGAGVSGASLLVDCQITGNRTTMSNGGCGSSGGGVMGGVLQSCTVSANFAGWRGGGVVAAQLTSCVVTGNSVGGDGCGASPRTGGGLVNCTAERCVISDNSIHGDQGGAVAQGAGAHGCTLTDCLVENNRAEAWANSGFDLIAMGGGAYDCDLFNCTLSGNEVSTTGTLGVTAGGGMYLGSADGCWLEGNRAGDLGYFGLGGGAAAATAVRSVLLENEADHGGAAWKANLQSCTLTANVARNSGGAVSGRPASPPGPGTTSTLADCIVWANAPDELEPEGGLIAATYSDVLGGYPGIGNIDADPRFWSHPARDFRLRPDSPCIDTGDPTSPPDPDGSVVDMGAFAFDPYHCGAPEVYCVAKQNSHGCTPAISFSGEPTVTGDDDFFVHATQIVNQRPGLMIWGTAPAELPLLGGTLCVAPPVVRTRQQGSGGSNPPTQDCTGSFWFHFSQSYAASKGLVAGDQVFAQYWYRDPAHPDGTGAGLTDALDFTLCP